MSEKKQGGVRKVLYMVFSVIVAVILWTYVVYVDNPTVGSPITVSGIQVEFTGEETLRDNGYIVSDIDVRRLNIAFGGRIREVTQLSRENVRAVVDLTDIFNYTSPTGTHSLNYELVYDTRASSITVESASRTVIEVTVERMVTQTILLQPVYNGSIAENYMAGTLSLNRDTVEISGTESAIANIDRATVTLKRDNLSETVTQEENIELYDAEGNLIDMEEAGLTFVNSNGKAMITQTVLMIKDVPVRIDIVEGVTATDANTRISYSVPYITLSGDPEILEDYNEINLGTVDLKSFATTWEEECQVRIPNNTTNESNVSFVTVTITVANVATRRLSAGNITYRNASDNDVVSIITQSLDITLRGLNEEELQAVTSDYIRIVADLSDYAGTRGTCQVPARVYVDGFSDVEAVGDYKVTVIIADASAQ